MPAARARRHGPSRGRDTAWLREQVSRNVDPPADTELRLRSAEREVERLRKSALNAVSRDQRVRGNQRTMAAVTDRLAARLAWHLSTHHGVEVTTSREYGYTAHSIDGQHLGVWRLDAVHEEQHGRTL